MIAPWEPVALLLRHGGVVRRIARRELVGRYRGSSLGLWWAAAQPLLLLSVYTFVFAVVFRARWGTAAGGEDEAAGGALRFALAVLAGLIVYQPVADAIVRGPSLLRDHAVFVKKVVFPTESLAWSAVAVSALHAGLTLLVFLVARLCTEPASLGAALGWLLLTLPPVVLLSVGVTWLLAGVGALARDTQQIAQVVATLLLFVSPVFYPAELVPEGWRWVIAVNPVAAAIEINRAVLLEGTGPGLVDVAVLWAVGIGSSWAGLAAFRAFKGRAADLL